MPDLGFFRSWVGVGLGGLLLLTTGCAGSLYGWTVQTMSTDLTHSPHVANVTQGTIAVLTPLSVASLRGNEAAMGKQLGDVIQKIAPHWNVVSEHESINLINKHGLASLYAQLRSEAELSHVLDRDTLRKIGEAVGAQYVFQPRLASFSQAMTNRWTLPLVNILLVQTRSAVMRLSLQLWDARSGELIWSSTAESAMQSEAVSQDPVFMEEVTRVTFGSMLADFVNRRTGSTYSPLNKILDLVLQETRPKSAD